MYKRSFKDYFGRNRKALYMILGILLVSTLSLTIVYAALSVTLNITGSADISAASWDVHLDNVKVTSGSVSGIEPTITGGTTATFSTSLTTPGDFYEFTIDVVNNGSIDAMIDGVSKTPITTAQAKYLNYIVEYENGESINTKQLVAKESFVRLKVRVEFRKDITASDLPTTSETLNLAFTVNYIQSDGTGSSVTDNGVYNPVKIVSGDLYTIGSEICFDTECFYLIEEVSADGVWLLAKYNLHVGNIITGIDGNDYIMNPITDPTGIQDSSMLGSSWSLDGEPIDLPWYGVVDYDGFYEGSLVEDYVNNYVTFLEEIVGDNMIIESGLLSREYIEDSIACPDNDYCPNTYPFIYSTSYYPDYGSIYSDGFYMPGIGRASDCGVRPVIRVWEWIFE